MGIINKTEFELDMNKYIYMTRKSNVTFIYPTDTIYGIGCNAENREAVKKIRELKGRYTRPFSVIAPSKEWILENCVVGDVEKDYLKKLPGPYTLILNLKNKKCIAPEVNNDSDTLGVRIPHHWISDFATKLGKPIITTSANKTGDNFMTSMDNLDPQIKGRVDFIVYEGEKSGRPSKVINLTTEDIEIISR